MAVPFAEPDSAWTLIPVMGGKCNNTFGTIPMDYVRLEGLSKPSMVAMNRAEEK